eukprot:9761458-Alexandrium_andersonii.AAC.1
MRQRLLFGIFVRDTVGALFSASAIRSTPAPSPGAPSRCTVFSTQTPACSTTTVCLGAASRAPPAPQPAAASTWP